MAVDPKVEIAETSRRLAAWIQEVNSLPSSGSSGDRQAYIARAIETDFRRMISIMQIEEMAEKAATEPPARDPKALYCPHCEAKNPQLPTTIKTIQIGLTGATLTLASFACEECRTIISISAVKLDLGRVTL